MRDTADLDAEALMAIADPRDWAFTVLNKAIAQCDHHPDWVAGTWERLERMDDAALATVRNALDGRVPVADLDDDGHALFYDFFAFVGPHPEAVRFFADLRERGGGVGDDDQGRLVRGVPGGGVEVVRDADGKPV